MLNTYMKTIKEFINQGAYVDLNNDKELSISDITNNVKPSFIFCDVKTWIFLTKNGKSHSIIWQSSDDWNVGYIENGCNVCIFRDVPKFI